MWEINTSSFRWGGQSMRDGKKIFLTTVIVLILFTVFFLWQRVDQGLSDVTSTINDNVVQTESFSIQTDSTSLNTSAQGTVFMKADEGVPAQVQIVSSIEIDEDDWGGVAFYIPDGCTLSNITNSYPESETQSQALSEYVSVWSQAESDGWIEFGRDRDYQSTEGGKGTVIIEFVPDQDVSQPEELSFIIEVGSEESDGVRRMGTDLEEITVPWPET